MGKHPSRLNHRPAAIGLALVASLATAACGTLRNTTEQEITLQALHACDRYPGVRIDRVEADGRYWVRKSNEEDWRQFQACVAQHRVDASTAQYASAGARDLVRHAYFVRMAPPAGTLTQPPSPVSEFEVDERVTFFLEIHNSGQVHTARFKWYGPDGRVAAQQDRMLRDSTGATTTRTWFTQVLGSAQVTAPGAWSLELAIGDQVVGRYGFTVVAR